MTRRTKTADSGFGYQYVNGARFYSKDGRRYVDRRAPPEPGNHDEGGRRWRCIPIQVLHGRRMYSDDLYQWRIDRRGTAASATPPIGSFSGRCACEHDGNTVTKPCNMHLDWLHADNEGLHAAVDSIHIDLKAARLRNKRLEQIMKNQRETILDLRARAHMRDIEHVVAAGGLFCRLHAAEATLRDLERKQFVGAV